MATLFPDLQQRVLRRFPLTAYTDPLLRYRAVCTYILAIAFLVLSLPIDIVLGISSLSGPAPDLSGLSLISLNFVFLWGGAIGAVVLTRAGRQLLGALVLLAVMAFVIGIGIVTIGPPLDIFAIAVAIGMWMYLSIATLLTGTRGLPLITVVTLLAIILLATRITPPNNASLGNLAAPIVSMGSLLVGFVGVNWLQARGQSEAVQRVNLDAAGRSAVATSIVSITQRSLQRLPLAVLLPETAKIVRDTFVELDTVQIWLVESDRRSATLAASTDKADALQRQVGVGSLDVVGRVAIEGRAILVQNVPGEQPYRRNALLPGILIQLAVPLKIAAEVTGVLVVASSLANALAGEDAAGIQQLADQIALAIDNARQYETIQSTQAENRRLAEEMRANQRTVERLNQQLTGRVWSEYLRGRSQPLAYTIDLQSGQVDNFADWTDALAEAGRTNQIVNHPGAGTEAGFGPPVAPNVIALPISVRGQAVGSVEFELEPGQTLTAEQISAIQQVIERMGLSADNVRLFEEAQRLARREALISAISGRLQSAASVDSVLSTAAQNLADVLNAQRVAIRVTASTGNDDTYDNRNNQPGSNQGNSA